ncbi:unnamed protein product [Lactuca virosa]|uniref:Uncharacterized protein n=1 Tax=Lactuca virosa TaxID=75947 RepID=A0AAU9PDP0_9ASTR|nr:unnamed protein product [Lactuca virosa]
MKFLLTLFSCCGIDESRSSSVFKEKNNKSHNVSLVREKKFGGGKTVGKNGHWRPSLCTIYEEDVVKTKRIQVYVPSNAPSGYKHEFVLQGSWDMFSPVPTSFLF